MFDWAEWLNLAHPLAAPHRRHRLDRLVLLLRLARCNHLVTPADGEASGEVWAVHGGGFYHKQKYAVAPAHMPDDLHWFKWEAYWTWISGFSLLVLVYYVGAVKLPDRPGQAAAQRARRDRDGAGGAGGRLAGL